MFGQPRPQCRRYESGVLCFFDYAEVLGVLEVGLDIVEKGDGQGIPLEEVGQVDKEACFGVFVREEAGIGKFEAEDWCPKGLDVS